MIYKILSSKPHNKHYLDRYLKFIELCSNDTTVNVYRENHHICPKSQDLFPEYTSFKKYNWNRIALTGRQHFIAHLLLAKVYGKSQATALFLLVNRSFGTIKNSKMYESFVVERKYYNSIKTIEQQKRYTPEEKKEISNKATKTRLKRIALGEIINPNKGKVYDDVYKKNMSNSCKNSYRVMNKTPEECKKNSISNSGRIHIANTITKQRRRPKKRRS